MNVKKWIVTMLAAVVLVSLSACGGASGGDLVMNDAFAKAMPKGEITSVFGVIDNGTDEEVTVESVSSEIAERTELHEMVTENGAMVMRKREGGFVIPANGSMSLEPGGLHLMLINLQKEVAPGDEVTVTLNLTNGESLEVTAVARDMANAQESYDPEGEQGDDGGHEGHGDHDGPADDEPTGALMGPRTPR